MQRLRCVVRPILVFTALVCAAACSAEDKAVTIVSQTQGGSTLLTAKLNNATDVTITLTCDLDNMRPSSPFPITIDSDGKTEVPIVLLRVVDRSRAFRYAVHFDFRPGGRLKAPAKPFVYGLPYHDGPYRVQQGFLGKFSHSLGSQDENAVDWSMPIGTEIIAARAGKVVATRADVSMGGTRLEYKNEFNYIVIKHDDGTYAEYVHLDKDGVQVHTGDKIEQGKVIGLSGNTGYSSAPHLHFAVFNTLNGRERKTIPMEFVSESGKNITPIEGKSY